MSLPIANGDLVRTTDEHDKMFSKCIIQEGVVIELLPRHSPSHNGGGAGPDSPAVVELEDGSQRTISSHFLQRLREEETFNWKNQYWKLVNMVKEASRNRWTNIACNTALNAFIKQHNTRFDYLNRENPPDSHLD
tara:strand:+ start:305 stop:709 length:405 start_codon:yes stop_codon:yes gene_type:complete